MSANNIVNWAWLIESGRIQEATADDDYIVVGSFDTSRKTSSTASRTREYLIKTADFLAQGGSLTPGSNIEVCDITLTPLEAVLGPTVSYVNPNGGSVEDAIDIDLTISRTTTGAPLSDAAIYNSALEPGFDTGTLESPLGTLWNIDGWGNLLDIESRTYDTFYNQAVNLGDIPSLLAAEWVMWDQTNNKYYRIKFTVYGDYMLGENSVSYTRELITITDPCEITFSDGSTQTTAPKNVTLTAGSGVSIVNNSTPTDYDFEISAAGVWQFPGYAFVDLTNGDDNTAVVGDGNKSFISVSAAAAASDYIYLKSGYYNLIVEDSKTYYAAPGAIATTLSDSATTATNVTILGYLEVNATFGFNFTGTGSDVYAEILKINAASIAWLANGSSLHLKVKENIIVSCANGGGYACRTYGGSLIVESPSIVSNYTLISPRSLVTDVVGGYVEFRCPNIQILDTGIYGNQSKTLILYYEAFVVGGVPTVVFDLMGGKYTNLASTQSSNSGIANGALSTIVSANTKIYNFTFKNGTVNSLVNYGFSIYYNVVIGVTNLENLKLKSGTSAFRTYHNAATAGYATVNATDCEFEGAVNNLLGNGRLCNFTRCTFIVTDAAETEIFNFDNTLPTSLSTFTFKDCYTYLANVIVGETFTGFSTSTLGALNTHSSEVLGVGATDTWGGFTTVPTLTIPNINIL